MSIVRSFVLVLALVPSTLPAQTVVLPLRVAIPDLSWVGPVVAGAQHRAAAAMAGAAPALAQVGPAMAAASAGMARAHAALAFTDLRLQGLRMSGSLWTDEDDDGYQAPPVAWAPQDPADGMYKDARSALNRSRYVEAARLFEQVYTKYPKSTYAADAYYYQAYALRRTGREESLRKALSVLDEQRSKAPKASTRSDADELETRIRGDLARMGDATSAAVIAQEATRAGAPVPPTPPMTPSMPPAPPAPAIAGRGRSGRDRCDNEDDTQAAALNALLSMDADRALPILKKVLARRDEGSLCLRRKAVFMVSQHESRETEDILLNAARTDPDQEVREQAVWWLSQVDSPRAVAALDSILRSSSDPALQDKAIFALSQQDDARARKSLRDFALRADVSEHLREQAIFWIGQGDDPDRLDFLKQLYGQIKGSAARDKILFSVSQVEGNESQRWLVSIATDGNEDIELRKKALFWVGQSDIPMSELFGMYERMTNREMKEQMIFVYSQRSEKAAVDKLFQIARSETDKELQKKAIFWLGQSGDPRAADFLAGLLEKPN